MQPNIVISRLTLNGYKSFPDKTAIRFDPGVSVIVGPNGCGKSNICEGVSWVLGERGTKQFRIQTMADVIFSGSRKRKPLGMAEVSLSFYSPDGLLPGGEHEMEIRRRVFKDGGSEYRIDGKPVRLKDLLDMLGSGGFHYSTYSIISQGEVEAFLAMKGSDRRMLIEEAAGIARFREKRRRTELRLQETRANLVRIDDILGERERLLRSLKIQAGRARRYSELKRESERLKRLLLSHRHRTLTAEIRDLEQMGRTLSVEEARLAAALGERENRLAALEAGIVHWGEEMVVAERKCQEHAGDIRRAEALMEVLERQIATLDREEREMKREADSVKRESVKVEKELAGERAVLGPLAEEVEKLAVELETLREENGGASGGEVEIAAKVAEKRARLYRYMDQRDTSLKRSMEAAGKVERARGEVERLKLELARLADRKRNAEEDRATADAAWNSHRKREEKARGMLTSIRKSREEIGSRRDALIRELAGLRGRVAGWEREMDEIVERISVLKDQQRLPSLIRLPTSWEPFADTILSIIAAASVTDGKGGVSIQRSHSPLPEIVGARVMGDVVDMAPGAPSWLAEALPGIYLIAGDDMEELNRRHPEILFFTEDGRFAWGGVRGEPPYESAGSFSLAIRCERLESDLENGRGRIGELEASLESVEEELDVASQDENRVRQEVAGLVREVEKASARRVNAESSLSDIEKAAAQLRSDLAHLDDDVSAAEVEHQSSKDELAEVEAAINGLKEEIESLARRQEEAAESVKRWREVVERKNAALQAARMKLMKAEERNRSLSERHRSLVQRAIALERSMEQSGSQRDALSASIAEQRESLLRSKENQAAAVEERRVLQVRGEEHRGEKRTLEKEILSARKELDEVRRRIGEAETRLQVQRATLSEVERECREQFDTDPSSLEPPDESFEPEAADAEFVRMREQLQRLGAVNFLADREYEEVSSEVQDVRKERDDLVASLDGLTSTARELEVTAKRFFLETFTEVNRLFGEFIGTLFQGGSGALSLMDDESPLESGVDLMIQPPGKRLQNMLLLSGGEKSLGALALLMALFHYRSSPFLILDEVDAALDDANVERLLNLIRRVSASTQIILITHNRRTMEMGDLLLGVTMEEAGCSKVITLPAAHTRKR